MDYKDTEKEVNIGADPENVVGQDALGEYEKESCGTNDYRKEDLERDDYRREDLEEDDYEEEDYREEDLEEDDYEEDDYRSEDSIEEDYEKTLYRKDPVKRGSGKTKYRPHNLDDEDDDIAYIKKTTAGDIIFRIVFGILVFAICVTAVIAALLATGHLNGLIDKIESVQTEGGAPESEPDVTPTVRVTLTPTPAATATPEATETPKPTTAPDTSKAEGDDSSGVDTTGVMTFHEVNDVVTAKETTNLRNVPSQGEESFIVYILQNGETVSRTGMSDEGWSRLDYNGQVVYAMSNLLTTDLTKKETTESGTEPTDDSLPAVQTVFTDVNEQVTPKIEVNLRLLPSVTNPKATVVATIKNGEVITMTGVNEELGWSRVEYNGQTLYCISSYVEPVASEPAAQESAAQEAAAPAA